MLVNFGQRCFGVPRVFFSPDDPAGGDPPADDPPESKFTQAEVDKFVERRLASVRRENEKALKTVQDQVALANQQNKELLEKLEALTKPQDPPGSRELQGQLDLQAKRHEQETVALKKEIEELRISAAQEKQLRMATELRKQLQDALNKAGCRDLLVGERFFLPQIQFDEVEGQYIFNTKKGTVLSVEEGVADELPDYLRVPAMQTGGSGTRNGATRNSEKRRMLEDAKRELKELKESAHKGGGKPDLVTKVMQQQRKVNELEKQLSPV